MASLRPLSDLSSSRRTLVECRVQKVSLRLDSVRKLLAKLFQRGKLFARARIEIKKMSELKESD